MSQKRLSERQDSKCSPAEVRPWPEPPGDRGHTPDLPQHGRQLRPAGAGGGSLLAACRTSWPTEGWRRRCIRRRHRRGCRGRSRTGPGCTGSWRGTRACRFSFLAWSAARRTRTGISTADSATATGSGVGASIVVLRQVYRAGEKAFLD